jgi:hypothetical protein
MSEDKPERIGTLERFTFGKGITREAEGTWTKEYIEIEVKLPEKATDKDFVANFTAAEFMIDQLLEQPKTAAPPAKTAESQVKITMSPAEVDALPWIASIWVRKADPDRKARTGEDAWMKEEECRDPRLLEMLKAGGGKFEMPGVYAFEHKVRPGYETGLIVRHGPKTERKTR